MTGFIDAVVRVETKKMGNLIQDMAEYMPYASIIGVSVAIPSYNSTSISDKKEIQYEPDGQEDKPNKAKNGTSRLTKVQKLCLEAILAGCKTDEEIKERVGLPKASNTKRAINNLRRKKCIKGHNGSYVAT